MSSIFDMYVVLVEVVRIALDDEAMFLKVGDELDLSDEELNRVREFVASEGADYLTTVSEGEAK
jgi:hypothetical protein